VLTCVSTTTNSGHGFIPEVLHVEYLDGVVTTTSDESIEMARRLSREEGIFCGISSGCNVAAAIKVAQRYPDIGMVVTVLSDNGLRYFSTELCGVYTELEVPDREHPMSDEDKAKLARVKLL
jgi:cysteine synthase A